MIDLSKHIQEGARLELEALEASADECSFLSAQNSAQAMRIDELQAEIGRLRLDAQSWWKKVSDLEAEIDNWKSWGVIEVAIRNPNVSSYMKHWEERAERAEAKLAECEGLRKDAERYRWLRKHGNSFYNCIHYQGVDEVLDAAIDAAIAAGKEGK